jgi:hypothetical protein
MPLLQGWRALFQQRDAGLCAVHLPASSYWCRRDTDAYGYTDGYGYTDTDAYGYTDTDAYGYTDTDGYGNCDCNCHSNSGSDTYAGNHAHCSWLYSAGTAHSGSLLERRNFHQR